MTVPPISRIPAVLDGLAEVVEDALADVDDPIEVLDGARVGELPWRHLMLGVTDSPDSAPYTTQYERQDGLGAARYVESWEVRCGLCLAAGDTFALKGLRAEVAGVLQLIDEALRGSHRLVDVWDDAAIGDAPMTWFPVLGPQGATVAVFFSIEGRSVL